MRLDVASIQKAYKRYAKYYNFYFGWIFNPGRKTAVELTDQSEGAHVLEVGVGTGLSLPLYPSHVKVTGIDISNEMLHYAKELVKEDRLKNVEALLNMDAENMSFPDNSFDSIVAMYVATVVPNPKRFVKEMSRVCKPGGKIILLNHFANKKRIFGKAAELLSPISRYVGFRTNLTLEEFTKETGFEIENKISVNVMDLWTILVSTNKK
ncbi:MAG: hypothetical protein A4S09_11905 [Proteobacteria bacterium SG_bin7]|nr:MAG: hypothetical protein A4S09_11905 [Proteobacteria bacterium SG_bin7]